MVVAASEVVIRTRNAAENRYNRYGRGEPEYILMDFPSSVKLAVGFPKGHIVERTATTITHKVNAVKLLNWLYENGHSTYNATMLVQQTRDFERLVGSIDRMFEA